jgi:thiol-disulfide isomerase/thioredoxin
LRNNRGILHHRTSLAAFLLVALNAWVGTADAGTESVNQARALEVGSVLPGVPMNGLNGPDRLLSSYVGKPLIINVWASWCGPCRAEAGSLERFAWSDAGKKYTVIGVSTDDYRALAERWLKQSNATLSHYIDRNLALENLLGAQRIPVTVLVDARGRVVARIQGARDWDSAESLRLIEKAFADFRRAQPKG